jgi:hypothetical protein
MPEYDRGVRTPIVMINSLFHKAMKGRMRPWFRRLRQTMLYWIIMNVLYMSDKIAIISDLMFPVTPLPDCLLTFIEMGRRLPPFEFIPALPAEMTLDPAPALQVTLPLAHMRLQSLQAQRTNQSGCRIQ